MCTAQITLKGCEIGEAAAAQEALLGGAQPSTGAGAKEDDVRADVYNLHDITALTFRN